MIKQYPKGNVLIEGHTDAKGADSYNLPLSQKRANAVKDWLVKKGGVDGRSWRQKAGGNRSPLPSTPNRMAVTIPRDGRRTAE